MGRLAIIEVMNIEGPADKSRKYTSKELVALTQEVADQLLDPNLVLTPDEGAQIDAALDEVQALLDRLKRSRP